MYIKTFAFWFGYFCLPLILTRRSSIHCNIDAYKFYDHRFEGSIIFTCYIFSTKLFNYLRLYLICNVAIIFSTQRIVVSIYPSSQKFFCIVNKPFIIFEAIRCQVQKRKQEKNIFLGKLWPGQVYLANYIQEGKQLTIFILSCQHFLISNINISSATMVP